MQSAITKLGIEGIAPHKGDEGNNIILESASRVVAFRFRLPTALVQPHHSDNQHYHTTTLSTLPHRLSRKASTSSSFSTTCNHGKSNEPRGEPDRAAYGVETDGEFKERKELLFHFCRYAYGPGGD